MQIKFYIVVVFNITCHVLHLKQDIFGLLDTKKLLHIWKYYQGYHIETKI